MRILFSFLIIFSILTWSSLSQANTKIAFIDLNYILKKSASGKKILNQLNEINKTNLDTLKIDKDKLNKKREEIKNLKNITSTEEYNKKKNLFEKKINNFNEKKTKLITTFEKTKQNELNSFFDKLNGILKKYMEKNSINVVLDKKNIIMANVEIDISEDILQLVDKYE